MIHCKLAVGKYGCQTPRPRSAPGGLIWPVLELGRTPTGGLTDRMLGINLTTCRISKPLLLGPLIRLYRGLASLVMSE